MRSWYVESWGGEEIYCRLSHDSKGRGGKVTTDLVRPRLEEKTEYKGVAEMEEP